MNLEQIITDELHEIGAAVRPPPPPNPALLVREADRVRVRTVVRSGLSVVLAAAVVLGIIAFAGHLGNPDAGPIPNPEPTVLPTGAPPAIPYIRNETLYVQGVAQPGSWAGVQTHEASSLAYLNDAQDESGTIVLFRDGTEVGRFPNVSSSALSPLGRKAAFAQRQGKDWFLVVYDLETRHEVGRRPADPEKLGRGVVESEAWESISAVDDDGRVSWGGVVEVHTWKPGSAPVSSAPPADPGAQSGNFPVDDSEVSLSPDGAWGAWLTAGSGHQEQSTGDPSQEYLHHLYAQEAGKPSSRFEFRLPPGLNIGGADWETSGSFLTQVFDDPTGDSWHYIRCTLATRACEVAPVADQAR